MMEFETEDQQVEALKKWWKENGKQLIFGAVIGFGIIISWQYYLSYTNQQSTEASALFEQMVNAESAGQAADQIAVYKKIKQNYANTTYKDAAALLAVKKYYSDGNKDQAIALLDRIIKDDNDLVTTAVARERKARILLDTQQADEALNVLKVGTAGFEAIFEELKGDAYVLKQQYEDAKNAYDKALLLNRSGSKKILQMKRDNLGVSAADAAA